MIGACPAGSNFGVWRNYGVGSKKSVKQQQQINTQSSIWHVELRICICDQ